MVRNPVVPLDICCPCIFFHVQGNQVISSYWSQSNILSHCAKSSRNSSGICSFATAILTLHFFSLLLATSWVHNFEINTEAPIVKKISCVNRFLTWSNTNSLLGAGIPQIPRLTAWGTLHSAATSPSFLINEEAQSHVLSPCAESCCPFQDCSSTQVARVSLELTILLLQLLSLYFHIILVLIFLIPWGL